MSTANTHTKTDKRNRLTQQLAKYAKTARLGVDHEEDDVPEGLDGPQLGVERALGHRVEELAEHPVRGRGPGVLVEFGGDFERHGTI